jgi:hypothetical protein
MRKTDILSAIIADLSKFPPSCTDKFLALVCQVEIILTILETPLPAYIQLEHVIMDHYHLSMLTLPARTFILIGLFNSLDAKDESY